MLQRPPRGRCLTSAQGAVPFAFVAFLRVRPALRRTGFSFDFLAFLRVQPALSTLTENSMHPASPSPPPKKNMEGTRTTMNPAQNAGCNLQ